MKGQKSRALKKAPLKWSMVSLLLLCWLLPLALASYMMFYMAVGKINSQTERMIVTSADNALRICEMRMDAAVEASRNASYFPTVRESYENFLTDGNLFAFRKTVNLFLERQYCYDDSFLYTSLLFTGEPQEHFFAAYRGSTSNAVYQAGRRFEEKVMPGVLEISKELDTDVAVVAIEGGVYLIRNLMTTSYHPYAVLTMELNTDVVFGSLDGAWGYEGSAIYIDGVFLAGDNSGFLEGRPGIGPELFEDNNRECSLMKKNGEYYVYAVRKPERHYIGYLISLNRQAVIDETYALKYISLLLLLFMAPLVGIVFLFFRRKVTKPVSNLIRAAHMLQEGHFGYQIENSANSQDFE